MGDTEVLWKVTAEDGRVFWVATELAAATLVDHHGGSYEQVVERTERPGTVASL